MEVEEIEYKDSSSLIEIKDNNLIELNELGVSNLLNSLNIPFYHQQIQEHGITGEILIHLDHEALKDVGIHSVGQRLTILKEVYRLKVLQNVLIEEGHYIPPSDEMDQYLEEDKSNHSVSSQQIYEMLLERDDRISNLELEVQRLHQILALLKEESLPPIPNSKTSSRPSIRSPTHQLFSHHPLSNSATLNPITRNLEPTLSGIPDSPRSPMDSPNRLNEVVLVDSITNGSNNHKLGLGVDEIESSNLSPTTLVSAGNDSLRHEDIIIPLPTTASTFLSTSTSSPPLLGNTPSSIASSLLPTRSVISTNSNNNSNNNDKLERSTTTAAANGTSNSNADNPYRSFRVTLDDPCYKVLPAALKKYKIIDDWRQYALFICYGNTERCLSYDEKPLLLFQKLKDSNANPVFMLRHMKDIKSPISVASTKHALRRDKRPPNAGIGLDKPPSVGRDGGVLLGGGGARNNRLHYPPVLLPVGKDKLLGGGGEEEEDGNAMMKLPLPTSPREVPGYCISIYPYLAEREDEFDVSVGDTFIIISKTKGWWVVYRDLGPSISIDNSTRKSAWVPAGCLLETSVPPLSLVDSFNSTGSSNAAHIPIEPGYVISVSTPGVALMDYVKNGSDQLDVKKGVSLRILKRYNHWSYAIKEDGHRGWIPSWFCGRTPSRGDTPTTPTITSTIGRSGVRGVGDEEAMRLLNTST